MPIMILSEIRNSVRVLKAQGRSLREISRLLKLSRNTVRRILREQGREASRSSPCDAQTLAALEDAFRRARGNVVRVQQLLASDNDLHISYSTLTRAGSEKQDCAVRRSDPASIASRRVRRCSTTPRRTVW